MLGQRIMSQAYNPIADVMSPDELKGYLAGLKHKVNRNTSMLSSHYEFIKTI
jgi:tryptophan 7-halogenase